MLRLSSIGRIAAIAAVGAMVATACGSTGTNTGTDVGKGSLTGAGSTFVAPFFQKAFFTYNSKYPQVSVNYQAVGSGAGGCKVVRSACRSKGQGSSRADSGKRSALGLCGKNWDM